MKSKLLYAIFGAELATLASLFDHHLSVAEFSLWIGFMAGLAVNFLYGRVDKFTDRWF